MDWLRVFGKKLGERTSKMSGPGIIKQIAGMEYTYDSFDPAWRANMHLDWTLYGDEYDLSRVLAVSPDEKLRFVLEHKRLIPMDVRSSTAEDHTERARITGFNKEMAEQITELYGEDANRVRQIVEDVCWNPNDMQQLAMKAMFTVQGQQKEGIQDAKGLGKVQKQEQKRIAKVELDASAVWEAKQQQREDELVGDFSKYVN
jgi:hypothetical protein